MGNNGLTPHCSETTVKFTAKQSFKVRTQRQMVLISYMSAYTKALRQVKLSAQALLTLADSTVLGQ